jgi:hypothetical protein
MLPAIGLLTALTWTNPALAGPPDLAGAAEKAKALKGEEAAPPPPADGKGARVVVFAWEGKPTDYTSAALIKNVKSRISRPDALFFPDVDIYQAGRFERVGDPTPGAERGVVPADVVAEIDKAVKAVTPIGWNKISEDEWSTKADELRALADKVWFIDRPDLRKPLFNLYVQIGRAAENAGLQSPPYYDQIGGNPVNYFWYLAGALAYAEPELLDGVKDAELKDSIDYYKSSLEAKRIPMASLSVKSGDSFDAKAFAAEFKVMVNGLEVPIENNGLVKVPQGRIDFALVRTAGGFSMSESVEVKDERIFLIRDTAKQKMGFDFVSQLVEHPSEASPAVKDEVLQFFAVYQKLHGDADIYVAIPQDGNANKVLLWRWDKNTSTIQRVLDDTGGFPVRFAAVVNTGAVFNAFKVNYTPADTEAITPPTAEPGITMAGIPFTAQLRVHYSRLMAVAGINSNFSVAKPEDAPDDYISTWVDSYQLDEDDEGFDGLKEPRLNTMPFLGVGVVLGKEAANGIGPRGWAQVGFQNVPHVIEPSIHGGLTTKGPLEMGGRVKSLIDVDAFAGFGIPWGDTVYSGVQINFGLKAGVGLTF